MTKEFIFQYFKDYVGTIIDNPFKNDFDTFVLRHSNSKKWFALLMTVKGSSVFQNKEECNVVNVKCDEVLSELLRKKYRGIIPAYHMNKKKWITIILDGDVPDLEIISLIEHSFDLT